MQIIGTASHMHRSPHPPHSCTAFTGVYLSLLRSALTLTLGVPYA